MTTVKQMQRLWDERRFNRLVLELLAARVEASPRMAASLCSGAAAAALGLIRLEELNQSFTPLAQRLLRAVLATQQRDGGWGEPLLTAVCVRALLSGRGDGAAIARGLEYLALLQRDDGSWPAEPLRRMSGEPFVTAAILLELGACDAFRALVRIEQAVAFLDACEPTLDDEARRLWSHAQLRMPIGNGYAPLWS